jgi:hypothetical protein
MEALAQRLSHLDSHVEGAIRVVMFVVLDRLAIAAAAAVERYGPARTTMADPALVELVISADSDEAASARAPTVDAALP